MRRFVITLTGILVTISCICCFSIGWAFEVPLEFNKIIGAPPDECFFDVGVRSPIDPSDNPPCECEGGNIKTNQTHCWSLAKCENKIWVGTIANGACQTMAMNITAEPMMTTSGTMVCEFGSGPKRSDWRPPRIYCYDLETTKVEDYTQKLGLNKSSHPLYNTLGWRTAIAYKDKIFFAGTNSLFVGLNLLILDKNGNQLETKVLGQYFDARRFLIGSDGQLYLGVATRSLRGAILRWVEERGYFEEVGELASGWREGSILGGNAQFDTVGKIRAEAAWIEEYKGHIYATTWGGNLPTGDFQLWKSPAISELSNLSRRRWTKVWDYSEYTGKRRQYNDPVIVGGPLCTYKDCLYFGSMTSLVSPSFVNPTIEDLSTPQANLFRLHENEKGECTVELLIGEPQNGYYPLLPPNRFPDLYCADESSRNKNVYIWNMVKHGTGNQELLYIGTMNVSGFSFWVTNGGNDGLFANEDWRGIAKNGIGYGFDNANNCGTRQLLSDGEYLWVGTASAGNLGANQGWELWQGYPTNTVPSSPCTVPVPEYMDAESLWPPVSFSRPQMIKSRMPPLMKFRETKIKSKALLID